MTRLPQPPSELRAHLDPAADLILSYCWDLAIADKISFPSVIGFFAAGPEGDRMQWRFDLNPAGEIIGQAALNGGKPRSFRASESNSIDYGKSHSWWTAPCSVSPGVQSTFVEISHARRSNRPLRNHSLAGGGSRQYFHCNNGLWTIGELKGFWTT